MEGFFLLRKFPHGKVVAAKEPNVFPTKLKAEQEAIRRLQMQTQNSFWPTAAYLIVYAVEEVKLVRDPSPVRVQVNGVNYYAGEK